MKLNESGRGIKQHWMELPRHSPVAGLDEFIVMPNHIHGIVLIFNDDGMNHGKPNVAVGAIHELPLPKPTFPMQRRQMLLAKIVGRFKMLTAKQINLIRDTPGHRVWQRNYYEHIIRGEKDLNAIRKYIVNNPLQWEEDEENPLI
ncbi:MAG: transposase [Bacteroidota bacterium]